MLPAWFVIFAVLLRLGGGAGYAAAVIKGRAQPNPVTWFFWGLTPMIVFFAQLFEGVQSWSLAISFALGIGPLVIFGLSLRKNRSRANFTFTNITCAVLAAVGIVLWLTTDDPLLAIAFSVLADISASIPTVIKAYVRPHTEVAYPYFMSMLAMFVALLALRDWTVASFVFPFYIFLINTLIFSLVYLRLPRVKRKAATRP